MMNDSTHNAGWGMGPGAIILAAGRGTRMGSDLPKVCHEVGGRAMVCAVVEACQRVGCEEIAVVVGHRQELVRGALVDFEGVRFVVQEEQLGTGHAVGCARDVFSSTPDRPVLVLCGDGPLIRPRTLEMMLDRHRTTGADATLATSVLDDPAGYGRIVRSGDGSFEAIVEHADATAEQRAIREVNPSYYCFDAGPLFESLRRVRRHEGSGEYYITDVPGVLLSQGGRVEVIDAVPAEDVLSINTPEQLAVVDAIYRARRES